MPKQKLFALFFSAALALQPLLLILPQARASVEPYERTFIVTAYYSPKPDQSFYVTGSYAKDIRLNGNGTNGADGTPVYPGMIAAPGSYSFGTQINCPPYMNGVIHDRGGAIVKAGNRNNAYDRLDFWAGEGEEALKTALYWGKRTLKCTVHPAGSTDTEQYVKLPHGNVDGLIQHFTKKNGNPIVTSKPAPEIIPERYRTLLGQLGYDPEDPTARIAFQIRHGIIASENEASAGRIGQQTKATLDDIANRIVAKTPRQDLQEGEVDPEVRKLQEILVQLGYLKEKPTAIFGAKTKEALITFQLEKGLIDSSQHQAAGFVGPSTQKAFAQIAAGDEAISSADREIITRLNADKIRAEAIARADALGEKKPLTDEDHQNATDDADEYRKILEEMSREWIQEHSSGDGDSEILEEQANIKPTIQLASLQTNKNFTQIKEKLETIVEPFHKTLSVGTKHEDIRKIQQLLQAHDYYQAASFTDYFGEQTRLAIARFQVDSQVVSTLHSPGAGVVGPKTLKALNELYFAQEFSVTTKATAKIRAPAVHPNDLKTLQQASLPITLP
jgi:peptidoglycan hydrolase-like protein with peptidoglycan-binding domain